MGRFGFPDSISKKDSFRVRGNSVLKKLLEGGNGAECGARVGGSEAAKSRVWNFFLNSRNVKFYSCLTSCLKNLTS